MKNRVVDDNFVKAERLFLKRDTHAPTHQNFLLCMMKNIIQTPL